MSLKESLEKHQEDRIWMVHHWAEFVRTHLEREWSKQQNELIDALF